MQTETRQTAASAISEYLGKKFVRQWLADELRIDKANLSRMLNDTGRSPNERLNPDMVRRIAKALKVDLDTLEVWLALLGGESA